MTFTDLPAMLISDTKGWQDVARMHPPAIRLMLFYVVPMSLIPPVMFVYAAVVEPGALFPALVPAMALSEALLVAAVFFATEIAMVLLMGTLIRDMVELVEARVTADQALLLAAIVPTPLWIAPLALFIPSLMVNAAALVLAWVCCAALIRHGVPRLLGISDRPRANILARHVLMAGVLAWIALLVVQALLLSMVMGWR